MMSATSLADKKPFFRPKLLECLRDYTTAEFFADLAAGLTVGIVALPLAMAFAIASRVKPEAGILISALGGSRVQIGGPTGAFVVIVYGIIAKYGVTNLAICTIMAGLILLVMGLIGLGAAIKFIPYPVTMGFTSGIAVLMLVMHLVAAGKVHPACHAQRGAGVARVQQRVSGTISPAGLDGPGAIPWCSFAAFGAMAHPLETLSGG